MHNLREQVFTIKSLDKVRSKIFTKNIYLNQLFDNEKKRISLAINLSLTSILYLQLIWVQESPEHIRNEEAAITIQRQWRKKMGTTYNPHN